MTVVLPTVADSLVNPFRDRIVGDAWDRQSASDVAVIHKSVFDACLRALSELRCGDASGGMIIHGAAGSGKTHLIRRLREHLTAHLATPNLCQLEQIFAYVRLDTSPQAIARHVRNRVANDLLRRSGCDDANQFELMVIARLMAYRHAEGDMLHWWAYFRQEHAGELDKMLFEVGDQCGLSANFVSVLKHLVARTHRLDVAAWLRGESLSASAYDRLGIGMPADENPEAEALNALRDIARLAGSHLPLVICFDQVEALQTEANDARSLFAYGQLQRNLCSSNRNLLLISCMQSSLFAQLRQVLPGYQFAAVTVFHSQVLNPLTFDEAELLLQARLRSVSTAAHRPAGAAELWPLSRDEIRQWVGLHGTTPRQLLFRAAERFDQQTVAVGGERDPMPPEPDGSLPDWLGRTWEELSEQAGKNQGPNDTVETLRNSLPDLLHLLEPQWRVTDEHLPGLEYLIEGEDREARVGIALLDNSPQRLPRQLQRILEHVAQSSKLHKLVLLRDARLPIGRTAPVTRDRLTRLEQADAVVHWIAPQVIAAIAAARSMLASAIAGDLSFRGETVTHRCVIDWLRANLPDAVKETVEVLVLPAVGRGLGPTLVERLQEIMLAVPVRTRDEIAASLGATPQEVEDVVRSRPDLFGLVSGTPTAVFSARLSSRCLQAVPLQ
jgi:hypothetical protein